MSPCRPPENVAEEKVCGISDPASRSPGSKDNVRTAEDFGAFPAVPQDNCALRTARGKRPRSAQERTQLKDPPSPPLTLKATLHRVRSIHPFCAEAPLFHK